MKKTSPIPIDEYDVKDYKNIAKIFSCESKSVKDSIETITREYCTENAKKEDLDSFYILEISRIVRQYQQWVRHLPRANPFYAVKCNSQLPMLKTLKALGCGFDCASTAEIASVLSLDGVDEKFASENIIFANPCKQVSHIQYASKNKVRLTTADGEEELQKLAKHWPDCQVVLRICVDDSKSICQFSSKFGAKLGGMEELISICQELKLNLYGISFHVGSGCYDTSSFSQAIKDAADCFKIAEKYGYTLKLLDIGGGFPGNVNAKPSFTDISDTIETLLDELFPKEVRIIAEPGRYFAAGCYTLVTNIFGRKKAFHKKIMQGKEEKEQEYLYYINDGVYQSFNCLFFDHAKITPENIKYMALDRKINEEERYISKVFGPTCDALDTVTSDMLFPKLEIGDWIYFPEFGAYTIAAASPFNGFLTVKIHYIWRE